MRFLTFTIFAVVALARSQGVQVQTKRGAQQYAQAPAAALAYSKVQQPVQKVAAAPQPQYYTQQAAAAPSAYSFPQQYQQQLQQQYQYQPQTQALAYAQPGLTKYSAAPAQGIESVSKVAAAYRQPFSLANDVSSFTYSSPVVTYNNLGLLSQVVGKIANPPGQAKAAVQPAAPAPAVYQTAVQQPAAAQLAYSAAPEQSKLALQQRYVSAAAPQQYLGQVPQQAYLQADQAQALQAAQAYQSAQTYSAQAAQSVPQSLYAQAPQYYSGAQQLKQGNSGVEYAQ